MKQKQVIRFMAYDDDLTDYVEMPELSKHFTERGLPVEETKFHWFEGGVCEEHFKIEIIKSNIVDDVMHTDILAQPL